MGLIPLIISHLTAVVIFTWRVLTQLWNSISSGKQLHHRADLDKSARARIDKSGKLYVANFFEGTITKFDLNGNKSIFASGLDSPSGLAFDSSGNLYGANLSSSGTIVKIDPSGNKSIFASGLNGAVDLHLTKMAIFMLWVNFFGERTNDGLATKTIVVKFDSSGNKATFASD